MKVNFKRVISAVLSATMLIGSVPAFAANQSKTTTITVGKDGDCDYKTIQEALNSIKYTPTEKYRAVIRVNPGTYNESVTIDKPYVTITNARKSGDVVRILEQIRLQQ